jgi:MFS transporter, DHA1 family, tetracycline resistance protein
MLGPLLAALLSPLAAGAPYWAGALVALIGVVVLSMSTRRLVR